MCNDLANEETMDIVKQGFRNRYDRAKEIQKNILDKRVIRNATLFPIWIGSEDCFWYERDLENGKEYRLVNVRSKTNECAFDHHSLANALAEKSNQTVDAYDLPIGRVKIDLEPLRIEFSAFDKRWFFEAAVNACTEIPEYPSDWVVSPDGKRAAFARDHNVWVRDLDTDEEKALTYDGEPLYEYGATSAAWGDEVYQGFQVIWSPDSKRLLTVQRDLRQVKIMPVVHHVPQTGGVRPTVECKRIAFPGDDHVETFRLLSIDVESEVIQDAGYPRLSTFRNGWGLRGGHLGWWAQDGQRAYFIDMDRGERRVRIVEFDTDTGATTVLVEEVSDTQINLSANSEDHPPFFVIAETNELVWWSERSGWAHLYLYDLDTGVEKHAITAGHWQVRDVIYFDAGRREVFVTTAGRSESKNPYYRDVVRINIDTGAMQTIVDSDHEYVVTSPKVEVVGWAGPFFGQDVLKSNSVSSSTNYIALTRSRADQAPMSLVVDRNGNEIMTIERADVSRLPQGWQWPEPVKLLAADGKTDIYGLVFKPSDFCPQKTYPVLSHVYRSPDMSWVAKGSFSNGTGLGFTYRDAQVLAELGFIVVQIDGRGTTYRNKAFLDEGYGWLPSTSKTEDHVAGLQQLAQRYPYMDLERLGVVGLGTGLESMLEYPDFYKVGVIFNHYDTRVMPSPFGEKHEGLSGRPAGRQYAEEMIDNFKGKLLLMAGMLDSWHPPAGTFRIVEALSNAGKDFELLLHPNVNMDMTDDMVRRQWDFLVRHLQNVEP